MTSTEKAAAAASVAAPGVFTLGDRTFVVPAPTGEDYGALLKEMRRQVMAAARDPIDLINERIAAAEKAGKPFSPTVVQALVNSAVASSGSKDAKAEPSMDQITARSQELDGLTWWAWYLVRKADPAVTLAQVKGWVPDDAAAFKVSADIGRLSEHKALDPN